MSGFLCVVNGILALLVQTGAQLATLQDNLSDIHEDGADNLS